MAPLNYATVIPAFDLTIQKRPEFSAKYAGGANNLYNQIEKIKARVKRSVPPRGIIQVFPPMDVHDPISDKLLYSVPCTQEELDPKIIKISTELQRDYKSKTVKHNITKYNPTAIRDIVGILDTDTGTYFVQDGRHTCVTQALVGDYVTAKMYHMAGSDPNFTTFAAGLFEDLNTGSPVSSSDKFSISILKGDPDSIETQRLFAANNCHHLKRHVTQPGHRFFGSTEGVKRIRKNFGIPALDYATATFFKLFGDIDADVSFVAALAAIHSFNQQKSVLVKFDMNELENAITNGLTQSLVWGNIKQRIVVCAQPRGDLFWGFNNGGQGYSDRNRHRHVTWRVLGLCELYNQHIVNNNLNLSPVDFLTFVPGGSNWSVKV